MSWAKFDDQYPDHPKIVEVGPLGMALHAAATCYCARYLTNGFVPFAMINRLVCFDDIFVVSNGVSNAVTNKQVTDELVRVGLFEVVQGGYMVHDYLDYNPKSEQVREEKAKTARRQQEWKEKHRGMGGAFISNGVSNGVSNASNNTAPSPSPYPSPSPSPYPIPEEERARKISENNELLHEQERVNLSDAQISLEVVTGIPISDFQSLDKIVEMNPTREDVQEGYNWYYAHLNGKRFYLSGMIGPIQTAMNKRLQKPPAAKKPEPEIYYERCGEPMVKS